MPGRISTTLRLMCCFAALSAAGAAAVQAAAPTTDAALQVYGGRWELVDLTSGLPANGLVIGIDRCRGELCGRAESRVAACGKKMIDFETDGSSVAASGDATAALANATEWPIKGTMIWPGTSDTYMINGFVEEKGGGTRNLIIWGSPDSRRGHGNRLEARFKYVGPSGCEPATA